MPIQIPVRKPKFLAFVAVCLIALAWGIVQTVQTIRLNNTLKALQQEQDAAAQRAAQAEKQNQNLVTGVQNFLNQQHIACSSDPVTCLQLQQTATTSPEANTTTTPFVIKKTYDAPYPLVWREPGATFSLTGISLGDLTVPADNIWYQPPDAGPYGAGTILHGIILWVQITMDNTPGAYANQTLRRITNEQGNMAYPNATRFMVPGTGVAGADGTTYKDQQIVFVLSPNETLFTFTTGGTSNIYFQVQVNPDNTLELIKTETRG